MAEKAANWASYSIWWPEKFSIKLPVGKIFEYFLNKTNHFTPYMCLGNEYIQHLKTKYDIHVYLYTK